MPSRKPFTIIETTKELKPPPVSFSAARWRFYGRPEGSNLRPSDSNLSPLGRLSGSFRQSLILLPNRRSETEPRVTENRPNSFLSCSVAIPFAPPQ